MGLPGLAVVGGTILASETYTRTLSGEPTRIDREDGSAVILDYDDALRSYTYDRDGNRLTRNTVGGPSETYTYGPGFQLASVSDGASTANYNHDAGGRVDAFDGNTLTYDTMDHVTQVATGAATYDYTYDGEGRRIGWSDGTVNRDVLVASNRAGNAPGYESPLLVSDAGGVPIRSYVYAGEHALMRVEDSGAGPEATYYLRDAMGSVIALADASGNRVARFDYDAFGGVESGSGPAPALPADGDFRHHGMWLDPHGLYHVRNRTYDSSTGRFTSKDPVEAGDAVPEAWMPYVANRSNPFVWRDPEGFVTLADLGIADKINTILSNINRIAARQAFEVLREEAFGGVGDLLFGAIVGSLPLPPPDGVNLRSIRGELFGNEFDELLSGGLCDVIGDGGVGSYLYLDSPISRSGGRPLGAGRRCPAGGTTPIDFGGFAPPDTDLLFSREDPAEFDRRSPKRTFIAVQIKLAGTSFRLRDSQFRATVRHGSNWSYAPVFGYVFLRTPGRQKLAAIRRSAASISRGGRRSAIPLLQGIF